MSSVAKKPCQDYRIIYDVDDTTRTVTVAVVGYRREVYRGDREKMISQFLPAAPDGPREPPSRYGVNRA